MWCQDDSSLLSEIPSWLREVQYLHFCIKQGYVFSTEGEQWSNRYILNILIGV